MGILPQRAGDKLGPRIGAGSVASLKPRPLRAQPMLLRACLQCRRVVIAATTKLLRTKYKAHLWTCRITGRSTVTVRHL